MAFSPLRARRSEMACAETGICHLFTRAARTYVCDVGWFQHGICPVRGLL